MVANHDTPRSLPLVIGITGASGAAYAVRLVQILIDLGRETHLVISPSGRLVLRHELGLSLGSDHWEAAAFLGQARRAIARFRPEENDVTRSSTDADPGASRLHVHDFENYMAPIASGSFLTGGMVVCPCSGGTLSAVACGMSSNLIHRAASVHLKERRPLILVPRETPLSLVHLENLRRACEVGAVVLPAMPGWYQGVSCVGDLVDFIVARILDHLHVPHHLSSRWGDPV